MFKKLLLTASTAIIVAVTVSGCSAKGEITISGTIKFEENNLLEINNPELHALVVANEQTSRAQGRDSAYYVLSNGPFQELINSLRAGESATNGFARYYIQNGRLSQLSGTSLIQLYKQGRLVASNRFGY